MHVLHLTSGHLLGGVERLLVTLAAERALAPMQPEFGLACDGAVGVLLRTAGVPVHVLGPVRLSRPWLVGRARASLRALVERARYDAVVVHGSWSQAVWGGTLRRANMPSALWVHDPATGHWVERWSRTCAPDLLICNSQFNASTWAAVLHGVPREVIHPPVCGVAPLTNRASVRAHFGARDRGVIILQAGRMARLKGHRVLLEALASLRRNPRWTCWQIGGAQTASEARYLRDLQRQAVKLGIADRVKFLGTRADIADLLAAADIYCQPNIRPEGFGLTFVEALAAELPVVTTDLGGAREIVHDGCGVLIAPRDPQGLATALEALIDDEDRRHRLGRCGPRRTRELCDPRRQLSRLADAVDRLVRGGRSTAAAARAVS